MAEGQTLEEQLMQAMSGEVPDGLKHIVLCMGKERKDVYGLLYRNLKSSGVGGQIRTLVYPTWLLHIIRTRFGGGGGAHDTQYQNNPHVIQNCSNRIIFYGL